MRKGFTLIELLVVIAVLAVLAAGIFVALDPLDKINAANDAKVQNDVGQISQAMEAYATTNQGTYPVALGSLVSNGDLKIVPTNPGGYIAYSIDAGGATQKVIGQLKSKRYTGAATPSIYWLWCSTTGKAGPVSAVSQCP